MQQIDINPQKLYEFFFMKVEWIMNFDFDQKVVNQILSK